METKEILDAIQKAAETIATPNWAAVISAIASIGAVVVAVVIAIKQVEIAKKQNEIAEKQTEIADKQNRIALFEKRFELYNILKSCTISPEIIKLVEGEKDILKYLANVLGQNSEAADEPDSNEAKLYLTNCSVKLQQSLFLFSKDITPYIINISVTLLLLAYADVEKDGQEKFNETKQRYFMSVKEFEDNEGLDRVRFEMNMI